MDLTTLIDLYRGPLIGLIISWGVPHGDAVEIAQDSFADAWLNRDSCRGDWTDTEFFGRWLRGVALNQYRNWKRSRRRRERIIQLVPRSAELAASPATPESAVDLEPLRRAIARLPADQRQVVLMHYLEETSVQQVATLLGLTAKTVEGRLYRARLTLRALLGHQPSHSHVGRILLCL